MALSGLVWSGPCAALDRMDAHLTLGIHVGKHEDDFPGNDNNMTDVEHFPGSGECRTLTSG